MDLPSTLSIVPLYAAVLGLLFLVVTMRAGFYPLSSKIFIGDGGNDEMLRRIRGQGNFVETVPITLILLTMMELSGTSDTWLHSLAPCLW